MATRGGLGKRLQQSMELMARIKKFLKTITYKYSLICGMTLAATVRA